MKIGFVTIGQAPRDDVMEDLRPLLPKDLDIVEAGALDGLSREQVEAMLRPGPGEVVYVTRMRNGSEVKISKERLLPLLEKRIEEVNSQGADLIAILCSGEFPAFRSRAPIVFPDRILKGIVSSISYRGRAAVLIPAREQLEYARDKWGKYFENLSVHPISPYTSGPEDFAELGRRLADEGAGVVVMDCVGYSSKQREALRRSLKRASILTTRTSLARVISEITSSSL